MFEYNTYGMVIAHKQLLKDVLIFTEITNLSLCINQTSVTPQQMAIFLTYQKSTNRNYIRKGCSLKICVMHRKVSRT